MENKLKALRKKLKVSQKDLAQECHSSYQQISKLENFERPITIKWAKRLARGFNNLGFDNIEPWMLMADEDKIDNIIQNEKEKELIQKLRKLSEKEQDLYIHTLDNFIKTFKKEDKQQE